MRSAPLEISWQGLFPEALMPLETPCGPPRAKPGPTCSPLFPKTGWLPWRFFPQQAIQKEMLVQTFIAAVTIQEEDLYYLSLIAAYRNNAKLHITSLLFVCLWIPKTPYLFLHYCKKWYTLLFVQFQQVLPCCSQCQPRQGVIDYTILDRKKYSR